MQKDSFEFFSIECIVKPGSIIYHMHIYGWEECYIMVTHMDENWKSRLVEDGRVTMIW